MKRSLVVGFLNVEEIFRRANPVRNNDFFLNSTSNHYSYIVREFYPRSAIEQNRTEVLVPQTNAVLTECISETGPVGEYKIVRRRRI